MEEILGKLPHWIDIISQLIASITIVATLLAKAMGKMEGEVNSFGKKVLKALAYLPTLGVNPNTKKLEEQLKELQK